MCLVIQPQRLFSSWLAGVKFRSRGLEFRRFRRNLMGVGLGGWVLGLVLN